LLLEYKKKPFVPDAVLGLKLIKIAHMLLCLRHRPLEMQLTALTAGLEDGTSDGYAL